MARCGRPRGRSASARNTQRGQALIYGLFVLIGGLASLFFLFNTGQLTREKTKLVNTSDAVAYSVGVMNARALNFHAYTNRAMMANTVAFAQLVSLSSWVQYAGNVATFGWDLENPKFAQFYPSYYAAQAYGSLLQESLNEAGALERLATASDDIVVALGRSQQILDDTLLQERSAFMQKVADANYAGDGEVQVDALTDDYRTFVARYSGDDRTRMAETVKESANKDAFVEKRSWKMAGLYADCASAFPRVDWLDRRGGTELIGFDQWQALDTLSEKRWYPRSGWDVTCSAIGEQPQGWGGDKAADNPGEDFDPARFDKALMVNPGASAMGLAMSRSWGYSGLPAFYDLSSDALAQEDPRMKFTVRLRRDKGQTMTSEGRSAIRSTVRLNAYRAQPAGGDALVAVSTAENYFQREGADKDNVYGAGKGKPAELGSLFNPFWQVHLVRADADIRRAQGEQGVVLP